MLLDLLSTLLAPQMHFNDTSIVAFEWTKLINKSLINPYKNLFTLWGETSEAQTC